MIISSVAFVLCLGKFGSAAYNYLQWMKPPSSDPKNTFEKRNVCRKTMSANLAEMFTYMIICIVASILGK